ncbi:MAG: gliding motility-associated C-terminal domain-containing protein [Thermoflavifilum sp.]|nr:gliding motility-associated C-terminal domain-containing protein [Thermoflavifilum sp.]
MRKPLVLIIGVFASVHVASAQLAGPDTVCSNTFATFDCPPPTGYSSSQATWSITPGSYQFIAPSNGNGTRSITIKFNSTGQYTVKVGYSKSITYSKTVQVVYCPSTDCAGTKASAPFLFENFGTLSGPLARTPLSPPAQTTYKYLDSGDINDGQYIISDSVNNGRQEWVKTTDHTGNLYGGMMLVNASYSPDTFYTRVIKGLCQGAQYSFSAWLLNANGKQVLQNTCSYQYIYPNLSFVVLDAKTGQELGRVNTNDVSMKLKYDSATNTLVDDPTWQRYGFGFQTPPGVDSVKLIMYNIAPGGCGNDIAIDDIEFTYCGPTLIAYFNNSSLSGDTICAGQPDTIFASVTPGYFKNPTYQWQESLDGINWTNIPAPAGTDSMYIIPSTDTSDSRYYRFLAAEQGQIVNSTCNSPSNVVQLLVLRSPEVHPGDTTICLGGTATLRAKPGYTSYLWSTGDTTSSITVSPTTTTKYYVTATLSSGPAGSCTATDSSVVTVFDPSTVNLGPDTNLCVGDTLILSPFHGYNPPGLTYLWSTGDTTPSIRVDTSDIYWVKVFHPACGEIDDTIQVSFHPLPIVNIGPDTAICQGTSLTLNAGNTGASFLWSTGDSTQTITVDSIGAYWVRVTNTFGCSASDTMRLQVNPLPIVNIGPDTAICQNASLTLDAGNTGASFLWSTGDTSQTVIIDTAGTYWVRVTNAFGCSASDTMRLQINSLPIVNIGPDTAICQGTFLTLNAGNTGDKYLWSTGDTTQKITVDTAGTYWVRVTNTFGCSASDTMRLQVNPLPIVNIGPDTAICQNTSLTLDAGNTGDKYLWNTGDTTQKITVDTAGTYWVRVTNMFGCSASDTMRLQINSLPIVNIGPDTAICQNTSLTLDAGNTGASFLWSTGDTTQKITVDTAGTYWVRVTNAFGCSASDIMRLQVNPLPIVNIGPDTAICQNASLTLDAGNTGASFLWSTGDTSQTITVDTAGTYWVRVTNAFGCSASDTMRLQINSLPIVNIGPDTAICQNTSLTLNAGNTGASFLWNTGDTSQTITVDTAGWYWVTVTNAFGCSASDTMRLQVNPLPIVNIGPDTAICQGTSLTLNAGNTGASFLWNTGDTTQKITVDTAGTYWVRVTNAFGCSANDTMRLQINPLPIVNIGPDTAICQNTSLTLNAGNTGASFLWSTGDTTQKITVDTAGWYWVTVTNAFGCSASDTMRLQVNPVPVVQVSTDTAVCKGESVHLAAQPILGTDNLRYLWSGGEQTPTIQVMAEKDMPFWVRVTNKWGCSASDTIHLKVYPLPRLSIAHDTSTCEGQPIRLEAGEEDGCHYLWSTGDTTHSIEVEEEGVYRVKVVNQYGCQLQDSVELRVHPLPRLSLQRQANICENQQIQLKAEADDSDATYTYQWNDGSQGPTLKVSAPGNYWVITSNGFCVRIDTIQVHLLANTLPRLSPQATLCPNKPLVLDVSSPDAIAYLWNTGATTPQITVDTPGIYTVLINGAVCNYTQLDTVHVKQGFLPTVHILADDSLICQGDRLLLRALGDHVDGYRWQNGSYGPNLVVSTPGQYLVQAYNMCAVVADSVSVLPSANCVGDIIMPNAFTPNSDGRNDVFRPKVLHQVFDFELRIFNRWGQLLFMTHDWQQGWDGTFHGQPCDAGGYAWWVKYRETPNGPLLFKKGVLTLLR